MAISDIIISAKSHLLFNELAEDTMMDYFAVVFEIFKYTDFRVILVCYLLRAD